MRSVHAGDAALDAARAAARYEQAVAIARIAHDRNPLSLEPLFELAAIQQARGQTPEAQGRARAARPSSSPPTPRPGAGSASSGSTRSSSRAGALKDFQVAYYLDPTEPAVVDGSDRRDAGDRG